MLLPVIRWPSSTTSHKSARERRVDAHYALRFRQFELGREELLPTNRPRERRADAHDV